MGRVDVVVCNLMSDCCGCIVFECESTGKRCADRMSIHNREGGSFSMTQMNWNGGGNFRVQKEYLFRPLVCFDQHPHPTIILIALLF